MSSSMSSVDALLAELTAAPETSRATLAELVTLCRNDATRHELLAPQALEALAAFAASNVNGASSLLDLVATLACTSDASVLSRLAEYPSLLAVPLQCVRVVAAKKPSKRRQRVVKIALELLALFGETDAGRQEPYQLEVVTTLLRVLENPHDDAALLQRATDVVTACLRTTARAAAMLNAVPIFLRIMETVDNVALQRQACDALCVLGSERDVVPVIAANNAIHSVARCLRARCPRALETSALSLLRLLCDESQVFGQVIQEELLPLLFEILAWDATADATAAIIGVLEGVAAFATGCKLDVAAFVASAPCRGAVIVNAVTIHSRDPALVAATFRFFATVLQNATDLPQLCDSETLEALLSLFIVHGTSPACDLGTSLAAIVARLSRPTLDALVLQREDQSLPALFLCLRSHASDRRFAANAFAIVTKHWQARDTAKSAQGLSGFIGIAVEILREQCSDQRDAFQIELLDVYAFLREMLLSDDGGDVVLACGGLSLARALGRMIPKRTIETDDAPVQRPCPSRFLRGDTSSLRLQAETIARDVQRLLQCAIATAVHQSKLTIERPASPETSTLDPKEYEATTRPNASTGRDEGPEGLKTSAADSLHATGDEKENDDFVDDDKDDGEPDDGDQNDDDSDSDGEDDKACETPVIERSVEHVDAEAPATGLNTTCEALTEPPTAVAPPRHRTYHATTAFHRIDFTQLAEHAYYYKDDYGIQYPRHPTRVVREASPGDSHRIEETVLLYDPPAFPEPCKPPDANTMSAFVDEASRRLDAFVAADPETRARLVYENTALVSSSSSQSDSLVMMERPACTPSHLYIVPETSKAFAETKGLTFDSWFESGNLERAIQIGAYEYDLVLRRDLYTMGHTQWFYFAISNLQSGRRYRFNVINLCKPDSLFNQGLRPVIYSVKDATDKRIGWRRAGDDVYYFPNPFVRCVETRRPSPDNYNPESPPDPASSKKAATYFTLTFTLEIANADDTMLVAHSYPFTYSDQQRYLQHLVHQHRSGRRRAPQLLQHSVLCTTLDSRPCDLITISDFTASASDVASRRGVILTARVHPGETQASWIMRGVLEFLTGSSETARVLRRLFVFYVVPMLNPDGVFHGNSRCSLSACDLNRQWHEPSPAKHPTIYHLKELVRSVYASRGLVLFCDLHGHSRKKNVFVYGCDTKKRPNPRARHFCKALSTHPTAKRCVSFLDCSFKVSKDKETTARVVLTKELKLSWCFTLEASFGGASFGELQDTHFNTVHLKQVGAGLCEALVPAAVTDVGLRERIVALVDDDSVSLAAVVDSHLWEAGIISSSCVQGPTAPAARKEVTKGKKDATSVAKIRRRRTLGVAPDEDKKGQTSTPKTKSSRAPPKRVGTTLPRRKSSPATQEESVDKPERRGRRRQTATTDEPMVAPKPRLMDLLGSLEPPDEEDTQLYMLQSLVRGHGNAAVPPPRALPPTEPPTVVHRRRTSRLGVSDDPPTVLFRFTAKDAVPVILPPPMSSSDVGTVRSPKSPSKHIRFKGAGRQYAALTPSPRAVELVKSGSVVGYDPDLIHASSMALQQRAVASPTTADALAFRPPPKLFARHSLT